MDRRPESGNGSDPPFAPSISELVSQLRDTFLTSDFDRVEEALVAREAKLKAEIEAKKREIGSLQEKVEVERLEKLKAHFDKDKKRVQQRYEILVKKEEDTNVTELKNRIIELEGEKKKWVDDIAKVRDENCKLVREKREAESMVEIWKRKFDELNKRLLLVNGGGNIEGGSGVPFGGNNGDTKLMEIDVGSVALNRNEYFQHSTRKSPSVPCKNGPGVSAGGRLGMRNVIDVDDSDEVTCKTMAGEETASGQKNLPRGQAGVVGILKRKFALTPELENYINNLDGSDGDTKSSSSSSSSSSSGSFDIDSLPLSSRASNKKMATEAASVRLNSSSRGK